MLRGTSSALLQCRVRIDSRLTDFEYAFYTAVASNNSARELMQHDQLRELAVVLTQRVGKMHPLTGPLKGVSKPS